MKYNIIQIEFIRFLKDNDIFKQYLENIKHNDNVFNYQPIVLTLDYLFEHCNMEEIISRPFDWSATNEKYDFWCKKSIDWKKKYATIKKC